jgi:hypothetical protein
MTTLEARVTALENDVAIVLVAVNNIAQAQTLFASLATVELGALVRSLEELRRDMGGGDEWRQ